MSAAQALDRLQQKMRGCRRCREAGHEITPGAVFSGGRQAQIMIIGQAPGVTEVEARRPFNAGSGTRLFSWLARAGFDEAEIRARQYMTSVTRCFPGKANGGGDRVPTKEERELCAPFLQRELELVDPALILPVGRLAINLYFPAGRPLTKIIGHEIELDGRWVIPLPHPSGASRWHQIQANQERIDRALSLVAERCRQLGL